MTKVVLSNHVRQRLALRGVSEYEVLETINAGTWRPERNVYRRYELEFEFGREWRGKYYSRKKVAAIVAEQGNVLLVVTVYTYYH